MLKAYISKILLYVLCVYPTLARASGLSPSNMCEQRRSTIEFHLKNSVPISDALDQIASNPDLKIVYLGDTHIWGEWAIIPEILADLRSANSSFNCFLVEYDDQYMILEMIKEFDGIRALNNSRPSDEIADQALERVYERGLISQRMVENFKLMGFHQAVCRAHLEGFKIFAIDKPAPEGDLDTEFETRMADSRDEYMEERIRQLFADSTCEKAIFPVGYCHLFPCSKKVADANRKTIPQRLSTEKSVKIAIVSTEPNAAGMPHLAWTWRSCSGQPTVPIGPRAVMGKQFDHPVYFFEGGLGLWSEFEWSFIYPGED